MRKAGGKINYDDSIFLANAKEMIHDLRKKNGELRLETKKYQTKMSKAEESLAQIVEARKVDINSKQSDYQYLVKSEAEIEYVKKKNAEL